MPIPRKDVDRKHTGGSNEVPLALDGVRDTQLEVDRSGDTSRMDEGNFSERMKGVPASGEGHVPSPAAGPAGGLWFWDSQPALQPGLAAGWLAEGVFPEIDELRKEHLERIDCATKAVERKQEIVAGFEAEEAARSAALYAGGDVPPVTPTAEREDALRAADAEHHAEMRKMNDFYLRAVATFQRMAPVWKQQFAAERAKHAAEVEAAKEALANAERGEANVNQAEQWIDVLVRPKGGRYIVAPTFGIGFMTGAELAAYNRGDRDIEGEMNAQEPAHV